MITVLFTNGGKTEFPTGDVVDYWTSKDQNVVHVEQFEEGSEGKWLRPTTRLASFVRENVVGWFDPTMTDAQVVIFRELSEVKSQRL